MKTVLHEIFRQKRLFQSQHPLLPLLIDKQIPLEQRLSILPAMAFFVMCFGDLNKYILKNPDGKDPLQTIINTHAAEDEGHWPWYVQDYTTLGYGSKPVAPFLLEIWGEDTVHSRLALYRIIQEIEAASLKERLVIVEVIEEIGNVFFSHSALLAQEYEKRTGTELIYLGHFHLEKEVGHTIGMDHHVLAELAISDTERERMLGQIARVSRYMFDWNSELARYIQTGANPAYVPESALER